MLMHSVITVRCFPFCPIRCLFYITISESTSLGSSPWLPASGWRPGDEYNGLSCKLFLKIAVRWITIIRSARAMRQPHIPHLPETRKTSVLSCLYRKIELWHWKWIFFLRRVRFADTPGESFGLRERNGVHSNRKASLSKKFDRQLFCNFPRVFMPSCWNRVKHYVLWIVLLQVP